MVKLGIIIEGVLFVIGGRSMNCGCASMRTHVRAYLGISTHSFLESNRF